MEARRARAVGFRSVLHEASAKSTEYGGFPESSLGALGVSAEVSSVGGSLHAAKSCTCLGDGALARWSQRVRVNSSQHTVVMKDGTSIDANQLLNFIRAYGGEIFA